VDHTLRVSEIPRCVEQERIYQALELLGERVPTGSKTANLPSESASPCAGRDVSWHVVTEKLTHELRDFLVERMLLVWRRNASLLFQGRDFGRRRLMSQATPDIPDSRGQGLVPAGPALCERDSRQR
jgi:hypothetical protein